MLLEIILSYKRIADKKTLHKKYGTSLIQTWNSITMASYKYIIIDEFQAIARQCFNLTRSLADVTGAKVVAVGDDWQSIYAFAGSDITLFQKFL